MSSDNTNAIDKKKKQDSKTATDEYLAKIRGFAKSFVIVFFVVLIYFCCSGIALLLCKVAQSNILPTESGCAPYTTQMPGITPIQMNVFTTGVFTDPELSMKLEIPTTGSNMEYKVIEEMRDYKNKASSNFLANYFIAIVESLLQFNFSTINTLMNLVNGLPEILVVLVGPFLNGLLFGIGVVFNFFYFIYLYFSQMSWFFKENNVEQGHDDESPRWNDVTIVSPVSWSIGVGLVILFVILFFVGLPFLALIPFAVVCYCTITSMIFRVKLNERNTTLFGMMAMVLLHYKVLIVTILSITMVALAFADLGSLQGLMAIFVVCGIYYGVIRLDTFTPVDESAMFPLRVGSYVQAKKICTSTNKDKGRFIDAEALMIGGGGRNLSKKLKKLGSQLMRQKK